MLTSDVSYYARCQEPEIELEFGSVGFWEKRKLSLLRKGSRWVSQKNSSTNGKIESAQGTMGSGKRPLFSLSPSHRAPRSFSFSPFPLRHKEASAKERRENQQKHIFWARTKSYDVFPYLRDLNLEYFVKKSRSISFSLKAIGYNFVVASFVFEDLPNWIFPATARKASVWPVYLNLWA